MRKKGKKVAIFIGNTPAFLGSSLLRQLSADRDPDKSKVDGQGTSKDFGGNTAQSRCLSKNRSGFTGSVLVYDEVMENRPHLFLGFSPDEREQNFYIGFTSGSSRPPKRLYPQSPFLAGKFSGGGRAFNIMRRTVFSRPGLFAFPCPCLLLFMLFISGQCIYYRAF